MFANPQMNVGHLGLREGMRVADFGAGTGHYSLEASKRVGHTGKVYAIEVQKHMVKKLEQELKDLGVKNVDCIWGDIETITGTKLSDNSIDVVIISNVLFQASDRLGLIDEAKRVLKPSGKILLIDWKESYGGMGPSPHHVVTEKIARELFLSRGLKVDENITAEDHHYGIIFTVA